MTGISASYRTESGSDRTQLAQGSSGVDHLDPKQLSACRFTANIPFNSCREYRFA
jgi:hypothetical protein